MSELEPSKVELTETEMALAYRGLVAAGAMPGSGLDKMIRAIYRMGYARAMTEAIDTVGAPAWRNGYNVGFCEGNGIDLWIPRPEADS